MNIKGWIMLRVLLNRFHKGSIETLLHPLPDEDIHQILSVNVESQSIHAAIANPSERISKLHFSWLSDVIKTFPEPLQPYVRASLSSEQQKGLTNVLKNSDVRGCRSKLFSRFFLHLIYEKLDLDQILPLEYAASESLKKLTTLSNQEIFMLIDLLGVYDLVPEIRMIISKQKMHGIFQALPLYCQRYVKQIMHQQDKIPPQSLDLSRWTGDQEVLLKRLHRAGLRRLALSLHGCDETIFWHFLHQIDAHESAEIQFLCSVEPEEVVKKSAIVQVEKILKFIESKETVNA